MKTVFLSSIWQPQVGWIREKGNPCIGGNCSSLEQAFMRVWTRQRRVRRKEDVVEGQLMHSLIALCLSLWKAHRDFTESRKYTKNSVYSTSSLGKHREYDKDPSKGKTTEPGIRPRFKSLHATNLVTDSG